MKHSRVTHPLPAHESDLRRHVTDLVHGLLREHVRHSQPGPRMRAFRLTRSQQAAELAQALNRAQRNL